MGYLDNININDLSVILTEQTITTRYYSLIPNADKIINTLTNVGIRDTNTFINEMKDNNNLAQKTNLNIETLDCLYGLLTFHRFRPRRLKEIQSIDKKYIDVLIDNGLKTTKDIILNAQDKAKRNELARRVQLPVNIIMKILCLSDLMRLPGVKDIRASLYYDCGYKNINDISLQEPEVMKQYISEFIAKTGTKKSIPLTKELSTQIAWAKVYPKIISF